MLTYDQSVARLLALGHELHSATPRKFDLAHMRVLLEAMGHPERRFASVLIAGTNGKGSTAAVLASILHAAGHRTGLYTSPHLVRVNERIRVAGECISDPEFAAMHERVEQTAGRLVAAGELPHPPSFFEVLTAIAFEYIASVGVEIAVLEVGMGGRLDATNTVEPALSVITDIALDHQAYLGNTIAEIAREKAGILRPHGVMVTLPQHPEANDVLGHAAMELYARGVSAALYVPPVSPGAPPRSDAGFRSRYPLEVMGETITVDSPLVGRHQLRNLALAIAAAVELNQSGFRVSAKDIERGVRETRWPGRLQHIPASGARPEILLDVAHNPAGAWALRSALSEHFEGRPLVFLFGAMRDKAIGEMADVLFPLATSVVATQAASPRAAAPEEIRAAAARTGTEVVCEPGVPSALTRAQELGGKDGVVVITGSIYVVGEALALLEPASN